MIFPMARRAIRDVMGRLLREASAVAALRDGLEATHFLCGVAEGKVLATLVYSTPIDVDAWTLAARRLLATKFAGVSLELMGRMQGRRREDGGRFRAGRVRARRRFGVDLQTHRGRFFES